MCCVLSFLLMNSGGCICAVDNPKAFIIPCGPDNSFQSQVTFHEAFEEESGREIFKKEDEILPETFSRSKRR